MWSKSLRVVESRDASAGRKDDRRRGNGTSECSPADLIDARDEDPTVGSQAVFQFVQQVESCSLGFLSHESATGRFDGIAYSRASVGRMMSDEIRQLIAVSARECRATLCNAGSCIGHAYPSPVLQRVYLHTTTTPDKPGSLDAAVMT
jgi:hypothetical protein